MTTPLTKFRTGPARVLALFCLAVLLPAGTARGQVCGDVNDDDKITTSDAQRVLKAAVGQDVELICSSDQCAALEARVAALEALLANVSVNGDNLVLTGMNLQVVSGSGSTNGDVNGKGNIVLGYNESSGDSDHRDGSHNLVIGRFHQYDAFGGIVAGEDNRIEGDSASVLGGTDNEAGGDGSVVVGGELNEARQQTTVVLAGQNNVANGRSCAILSGNRNLCTGMMSLVDGGQDNFVSGAGSVIGGGSNRVLGSNLGWLAGALGPTF